MVQHFFKVLPRRCDEDTRSSKTGKETNDLSNIPGPGTDRVEDLIKSLKLLDSETLNIKGDYKHGFNALIFLKHYKRQLREQIRYLMILRNYYFLNEVIHSIMSMLKKASCLSEIQTEIQRN